MKQILIILLFIIPTSGFSQFILGVGETVIVDTAYILPWVDTGRTKEPCRVSLYEDTLLFEVQSVGLIIYYTDLVTKKVDAKYGTIYTNVYKDAISVEAIILDAVSSFESQLIYLTKEQIIKFIPNK